MITQIVEATNGFNWGKFLVGTFDEEWRRASSIDPASIRPLLAQRGWTREHHLVLDLETGEGAVFRISPHGSATADLNTTHQVWVCPLFEPFLEWLYANAHQLAALPPTVELPHVPGSLHGYRRTRGRDT